MRWDLWAHGGYRMHAPLRITTPRTRATAPSPTESDKCQEVISECTEWCHLLLLTTIWKTADKSISASNEPLAHFPVLAGLTPTTYLVSSLFRQPRRLPPRLLDVGGTTASSSALTFLLRLASSWLTNPNTKTTFLSL